METCFRCGRIEEEVRLFDGIYVNESVKVCEKCSLIENIPIIKLPGREQLKIAESKYGVYNRLKSMAGIDNEKKQKNVYEELREIEKNPSLEKPEEIPLKLVDNFNWIIQHERRRRKMSHKQLAREIGESETAVRLLERNNFPENVFPLIRKLEQFLRVRLIKPSPEELIRKEREGREKQLEKLRIKQESEEKEKLGDSFEFPLQDMQAEEVILREDEGYISKIKGQEEDDMVKEAIRTETDPIIKKHEQVEDTPLRILDFKKEKLDRITIADLREMQKRIEEDFPKKTSEELGKEQLEDFGKESQELKKDKLWYKKYLDRKQDKREPKEAEEVPSIHELVEKKKYKEKSIIEQDKEVVGKDIELIE